MGKDHHALMLKRNQGQSGVMERPTHKCLGAKRSSCLNVDTESRFSIYPRVTYVYIVLHFLIFYQFSIFNKIYLACTKVTAGRVFGSNQEMMAIKSLSFQGRCTLPESATGFITKSGGLVTLLSVSHHRTPLYSL